MRKLVPEDGREFAFVAGAQQKAGLYLHGAVGHHRCIELGIFDSVDAYARATVLADFTTKYVEEVIL